MKKPKISTVSKRCLKLWSILVHKRFRNKCAVCKSTGKLDAHHIIDKRFGILRFDILNGILLCPSHHKFGLESFHNNPIFAYEFLKAKFPNRISYLKEKSKESKKYSLDELLELEEGLKKHLGIFEVAKSV